MDATGQLRRVMMFVGLMAVLALQPAMSALGAPGGGKGGGGGDAKACQHGGYLTLQREDGTPFGTVKECTSYAKSGGVLVVIPTPTDVPTATMVPPTNVPTETPVPTATDVPTEAPTDTPVPTTVPMGYIAVDVRASSNPLYCGATATFSGFTPYLSTTFTIFVDGVEFSSMSIVFGSDGGAVKDLGDFQKQHAVYVTYDGIASNTVTIPTEC